MIFLLHRQIKQPDAKGRRDYAEDAKNSKKTFWLFFRVLLANPLRPSRTVFVLRLLLQFTLRLQQTLVKRLCCTRRLRERRSTLTKSHA